MSTISELPAVVLDSSRHQVCMDAAVELDALLRELPDLISNSAQPHLVARGVCGRALRLTAVVMSGVGEADFPTEKLLQIVHDGA